ncbi:MAG: LptA/OstA family protein [Halanaerobiales bacterium]
MIPIRLLSLLNNGERIKYINDFKKKSGLISMLIIIIILITFLSITVIGQETSTAVENVPRGQGDGLWADITRSTLVNGETDEIIAKGDVLLIFENYRIEADLIRYNLKTKDITAEGNAFFDNGEYQLYTDKISGNLVNEEFQAAGNVLLEGLYEGKELQLSSQELTVQNSSVQDNTAGTPEDITEDSAVQDNTQMMIFTGDVALQYEEIEAYSDSVKINTADNTAFMEGNVRGKQGGIRLSGEKLEIDLNTGDSNLINGGFLFNGEGEE